MGRFAELRTKEADGSISVDEQTELDEARAEAKEDVEETAEATEEAEKEDAEDAGSDSEAEKHLVGMGKKLAEVAVNHFRKEIAKDAKKASLGGGEGEKGDKADMPKGKERVKQFFLALFEKNVTKLDHLSGGTNADGGFLVPPEFSDSFVEARQNETVMRRAGATVVQIASNTFNLPNLATRPKAYWTNELAAKSSTSASWGNIALTPYTLACIMTASNQVIADAKIGGNLIDVMTRLMTQAIAVEEDNAFFTGSGSGQPTGLATYTPGGTVTVSGTFSADHLLDAVYRLPQGYRSKAVWFMNSRTLAVVRKLKDSQNRYIFENAVSGTDFPTILGRPVYEQDDLASNVIWFGDPSSYWIADREGVSVAISNEATVGGQSAFERNFTAVRVEERVDGELADSAGFVVINSVPVS